MQNKEDFNFKGIQFQFISVKHNDTNQDGYMIIFMIDQKRFNKINVDGRSLNAYTIDMKPNSTIDFFLKGFLMIQK